MFDTCFMKNVIERNALNRFHKVDNSRPIKRREVSGRNAIAVNSRVKGTHKRIAHEFHDAPNKIGGGVVYGRRIRADRCVHGK